MDKPVNQTRLLSGILFTLVASCAWGAPLTSSENKDIPKGQALLTIVTQLDSDFFDSFNTCDKPGVLEKHGRLMDANVEFYHDNGGVTWTRKDYLDKTRANVCGRFHRVLVPGTLEVYPIEGYGAIEEGHHMFCEVKSDKCFGKAKFLFVWHKTDTGWEATRIFSYGHEAID